MNKPTLRNSKSFEYDFLLYREIELDLKGKTPVEKETRLSKENKIKNEIDLYEITFLN